MYCAYIVEIKSLREHSNADRLLCTEVFGNNVIVSKEYKEGQKCIFFPVDGRLGLDFAEKNNLIRKKDDNGNNIGGYLDPEKRSITALKLRGEKSEGLLLPIESLKDYTDITKLKVGDQITVLNGHLICEKYIPRRNPKSSTPYPLPNGNRKSKSNKQKEKITYPFFAEHIDTSQLDYNHQAFKQGDTIYITRKLHGTSNRVANTVNVKKKYVHPLLKKIFKIKDKETKTYNLVSGTRRTVINSFNDDKGYYGTHKFRKPYHDFFKDKLPKGMEVFFEIVGWVNESTPIMGKCSNKLVKDKEFEKKYGKETIFTYGCEPGQNNMYVYRMTMTNEDGVVVELPTEEVKAWCERFGCEYVPILDKFIFTTIEDLNDKVNKWLDIPDEIDPRHVSEGVVVRIDNRSKFTAYKKKGFYFRVLEGIIKDNSDTPDMEEAEDLITNDNSLNDGITMT